VHCWGGTGRTGTVVGCYLVQQGLSGAESLQRLSHLRRQTPTAGRDSPEMESQRQMVLQWTQS
jgi:protein-tyrosine phosphatase